MSTQERRAPGAMRFPFEALVEVGGALGPTFEAQAVNVSEEGIQIRTAYLPDPGQTVTCRFDAVAGQIVLASGEVAWAHGSDQGGEFGVRFTDLDAESVEALKRVCGVGSSAPAAQAGSKVRLHIEGLSSPMRAKIKETRPAAVTVGSDLGFLQVGRQLELEDAQSGHKRPATIDRVEIAVDPGSQVPQLVVTLRYGDGREPISAAEATTERARNTPPSTASHTAEVDAAAQELRGAFARGVEKVGPALGRFAEQLKTTVALFAKQRGDRSVDGSAPRRMTAPPPNGALHSAGRRVVRGESNSSPDDAVAMPKVKFTPRRAALAGGVMFAAILGALALKKAHHEPPATASSVEATAAASASVAVVPATAPAPTPSSSPAPSSTTAPAPPQAVAQSDDSTGSARLQKKIHVTPFANGPVHHPNVLRLKMDGPIESIEGAQQPNGFAVKLPGRRSLEAAAPLAARDSRIAAIKVSNDSAGAELTVSFRDGVPNYRVSAHGETLVIALAPAGALDRGVADREEKGARSAKHSKHPQPEKGESPPKGDKGEQAL
ncbi:MAG: PilZ domain-containing protein [Polyangiaceae bacterium]|jgi:hypothetical protein